MHLERISRFITLLIFACLLPLRLFGESYQQERFLIHISQIRELLGEDLPLDYDRAQKLRGHAFALEELFKVYGKEYEELESLKSIAKELEDATGKYVDTLEHLKSAEALKLGKIEIAYLTGARDNALKDLKTRVIHNKKNAWTGEENVLDRMESVLSEVEWQGANKDREFLLRELIKRAEKIRDSEFNFRNTQGDSGLHELRRQIRSFSILFNALNSNGKFILTEETLPGFDNYKADKVLATSKYGKLPVTETGKLPILFPRSLLLAITKSVTEIGIAKDIREAEEEWLREMLLHLKIANSESIDLKVADLIKRNPLWKNVDLSRLQRNVRDRLINGPLLDTMTDVFEEQLDWSKKQCRKAAKKIANGPDRE